MRQITCACGNDKFTVTYEFFYESAIESKDGKETVRFAPIYRCPKCGAYLKFGKDEPRPNATGTFFHFSPRKSK